MILLKRFSRVINGWFYARFALKGQDIRPLKNKLYLLFNSRSSGK